MAITRLSVAGYRSINDLSLPLGKVNVIVGPNGCGKTNLYRSLYLLGAAAQGTFAHSLADEGGMPSVLWAGPRRKGPVRMSLGVEISVGGGTFAYELECGLPQAGLSSFTLDPEIKEERLLFLDGKRKSVLLERGRGSAWALDADGRRVTFPMALSLSESALFQLREPHRYPHISAMRGEILQWRFYHQFRTDPASPLRQPRVGIKTPVLSIDGVDLAAALQTIGEFGDGRALAEAVDRAFPGSRLIIQSREDARFSVTLQQPGFQRAFTAEELSDGTLRYLCLLAALLSPLPPPVIALNEPETSLHPDLLEPLAALIVQASRRSQMWITTHAATLAGAIERETGVPAIRLAWEGETIVTGRSRIGGFVTED